MNLDRFINGDTRLVCLLGYPVAHSVSPLIHNHAFRSLGLPYCYVPFPVPRGSVHTTVAMLRASGFAGANVTIPHKSAVTHCCDRLSPLSEATGTVNTLYFDGSTLCGTTTDTEGFIRSIGEAGHTLQGSRMVLLGNGGAARTLAIALTMERRIASLHIVGRNAGRVASLSTDVQAATGFPVGHATLDSGCLPGIMAECTLLVNCTNVGMHPDVGATPIPSGLLHEGMTVFDAIYNPPETRLLREAKLAGCTTENGLRMLLFQGLASFRHWTGVNVPGDLFSTELLQSLIERH